MQRNGTQQDGALVQEMLLRLAPLNLTQDEAAIVENYLMGDADEETLSQLNYRNFLKIKSIGFSTMSYGPLLYFNGGKETVRRFTDVLFALGKATCDNALRTFAGNINAGQWFTKDAQCKYLAIMAAHYIEQRFPIGSHHINQLEYGNYSNDALLKAMQYHEDTPKAKLLLLAVYFKKKYTNAFIDSGNADYKNPDIEIEKDDLPYLKEYENLIIYAFEAAVETEIPPAFELIKAVGNEDFDSSLERIRPRINARRLGSSISKTCREAISEVTKPAYINFPLSQVLRNVIKIHIAMFTDDALKAIRFVSEDMNNAITKIGADFDEIFNINAVDYITWAAKENIKHSGAEKILKRQMVKNREAYCEVIRNGIDDRIYGRQEVNSMIVCAKENDPTLFDEIIAERTKDGVKKDAIITTKRDIMMHFSAMPDNEKAVMLDYILGKTPLSEFYKLDYTLYDGADWTADTYIREVSGYKRIYGSDEYVRRWDAAMAVRSGGGYLVQELMRERTGNAIDEDVRRLFDVFEQEGVKIKHQFLTFCCMAEYMTGTNWGSEYAAFHKAGAPIFAKYLSQNREETMAAFDDAGTEGKVFSLDIMGIDADENKAEILALAKESAKAVKEKLLEILYKQHGWEDDIIKLMSAKKASEREIAVRVLGRWQSEGKDYSELFKAALEKEKNAKMASLLQNSLTITAAGDGQGAANAVEAGELVQMMHKGGKKRSLEWAYQTPFSAVHKKDGTAADEEYLQAILLCYSSAEKNGINANAAMLAESLNEDEFAVYVSELYEKWFAAGAEAKKRWVLYAASIHGGSAIADRLVRQIGEWAQNARGAIAAEAVKALVLNPAPSALLAVDSMSRKYKFKQVKAAAGEAMEYAAGQLGITREELADRIVPDLGFDENMERIFDYGERKFKVAITPALEIEVFDETGKKLKNLPAVGKKDDEEKASAAIGEFKEMKKQMKAAVTSQKSRLEYALIAKREWTSEAWKALFVKNPIMYQFAIGLVWGVYENGELVQSFRYMEDGTFNTEDEEEYELPEESGVKIALVHPIEMTDVSLSNWKQQLEDYEIKQPIEQLDRAVYRLEDAEKDMPTLERFGGCILNDLSLTGKLTGLGWYRGSVQDAGGFYTFYREDVETGLGVELHFSGSFVGSGYDGGEDITVYDARFYKAGTVERGSYCYDEAEGDKIIPLKDVPQRYFSEIVLQLEKATAASEERDKNWKNH